MHFDEDGRISETHPTVGHLLAGLQKRVNPVKTADSWTTPISCGDLGMGELLDRMPAGLLQTVGETGWRLSHAVLVIAHP